MPQRTLVIASSVDPIVPSLLKQLGIAFRNAKLLLDTFDLETPEVKLNLEDYCSVLLVCPLTINKHEHLLSLLDLYVQGGGGLVVANPQESPVLSKLCGIQKFQTITANINKTIESLDVTFVGDLFPASVGLTQNLILADVAHHILDQTAQFELIAEDSLNRPLAWRRQYKKGIVFVWNLVLGEEQWSRSWLVQSILSVQAIAVQGIANVAMVQIDDFPAPFVNASREPIRSEFGMSVLEFLDEVWLPDMLQIAEKYDVQYSFALPFNYNATIEKPFDFAEWEAETVCYKGENIPYGAYFAKIIGDKHELCLHGYNHVPLLIENWLSRQAMIDSLNAALDKWAENGIGKIPSCYVAPMNEYDRDGVLALKACLPSLKVICTEHSNSRKTGGREFEAEPWNKELFCLPRLTYGYELTNDLKFNMVSTLAELGVWTHLLHADDIFDIDTNQDSGYSARNPNASGWRDDTNGALKDHFEQWFKFVEKHFSWLRYMNATQAAEQIKNHLNNRLEVEFCEDQIKLKSDITAFIQLRIDKWHYASSNKSLDTSGHNSITVLDEYLSPSYSLFTLQIPAGTSKLKLI